MKSNLAGLRRILFAACLTTMLIWLLSKLITPREWPDIESTSGRFHIFVVDGGVRCIIDSEGDLDAPQGSHIHSLKILSYEYLLVRWPDGHFICQFSFPLLLLVALFAVVPGFAIWRSRQLSRQAKRLAENRCLSCGYDLRASKDQCSECGTPIPNKQTPPVTEATALYLRASANLPQIKKSKRKKIRGHS